MEIRRLRPEDRPRWLALLDGWDVGDGWRGRDFFRRYVELDPTYADENVWVAAEGDAFAPPVPDAESAGIRTRRQRASEGP